MKPKRIIIAYFDPFDDKPLCIGDLFYDARKSADGWYSRMARRTQKALKSLESRTLQGRTPKISVRIISKP